MRLVFLHVLLDVACDGPVAFFETNGRRFDNKRLRYFARLVIWHRDHGAVVDSGVGEEMSLELCGCDLVALLQC